MKQPNAIAGLLIVLSCCGAALAQTPDGSPIALPPVTAAPLPLLSTSGRFSSLNPPGQDLCGYGDVTGHVVSTHLIQADQFVCDGQGGGSLVNAELGDPADTRQMIIGRRVAIKGAIKAAFERRGPYTVAYLFVENARLVAGDPRGAPAQAATSFMMCQPPELDTLVSALGRELCVQSTLVANLKVTGPALEAAARAPGSSRDTPSGDPAAIACRLDPEYSDSHLPAIACARNSYWHWWAVKQVSPGLATAPP
jgi:hypothetical protein